MRITTDKSTHPVEAMLLCPCIMLAPYAALRFAGWETEATLYLLISVTAEFIIAMLIQRSFNVEFKQMQALEARAARAVAAGDHEELAAAIAAWEEWKRKHPS